MVNWEQHYLTFCKSEFTPLRGKWLLWCWLKLSNFRQQRYKKHRGMWGAVHLGELVSLGTVWSPRREGGGSAHKQFITHLHISTLSGAVLPSGKPEVPTRIELAGSCVHV